jgi:hypothetical protein
MPGYRPKRSEWRPKFLEDEFGLPDRSVGREHEAVSDMLWYPIVEQDFGPDSRPITLDQDVRPRRCRFCERDETVVAFKHEAHVIPAALGNSTVFTKGECDECNHRFGEELEDDFVNFLGPLRTISGIRARTRVPTFRRRSTSAPIRHGGPGVVRMDEEGTDDALVLHHGEDGKSLAIEVEYPPFDLSNVGRALARMSLFYLRAGEGSSFRHVLEWVRGDIAWLPRLYEVLLPGGVSRSGLFMILAPPLEHRNHTHVVCLVCSYMAYFLPLPSSDWTVADTPWTDLLRPFSIFGSVLSLGEFQANQSGRVTGFRRTFSMKQTDPAK